MLGVAAGSALGAPLVGLALLRQHPAELAELDRTPTPALVEVSIEEVDNSQAVTLTASWGPPMPLLAPGWSGTVGTIPAPGTLVRSGEPFATIAGVQRLAWHLEVPFYRTLSRGSSGADVAQLQTLLTDRGLLDSAIDGQFGSATAAAVKHLSESLGVAPPTTTFDPAWIVYLPTDSYKIGEVLLQVAGAAPPAGAPIAEGPPQLTGLTAKQNDATLPPGEWLVTIDGTDIPVTVSGTTTTATTDISGLLTQPAAADGAYPATTTAAVARPAQPVRAARLPAGAVSVNDAGDTCVWAATGTTYQPHPVQVALTSATQGTVWVQFDGPAPPDVVANPNQVVADPACPST